MKNQLVLEVARELNLSEKDLKAKKWKIGLINGGVFKSDLTLGKAMSSKCANYGDAVIVPQEAEYDDHAVWGIGWNVNGEKIGRVSQWAKVWA